MNFSKLILEMFIFINLFCLIITKDAFSYLDPGTGSYIIQILAAVLFGSIFMIKIFWSKIKLFFKGGKKDEEDK